MRLARACTVAAVVFGAILEWSTARTAEDGPTPLIRYSNDTLTLRVTGMANDQILREIAHQSGAEIRGRVREPHELSADFDSVPLAEALTRVLGEQNFALVYANRGRLKAIRLLGGSQTVVEVAASPTATTLTDPGAPFPGALAELIDRHPPVPVGGHVAAALGTRSATLRQLLDLSLHHGDADVRAEAVHTGLTVLETEPQLRSALISEVNNAESAFLSGLLRSAASGQAEEVAMQVLREARTPEIRVKASAVVQRLRAGDQPSADGS